MLLELLLLPWELESFFLLRSFSLLGEACQSNYVLGVGAVSEGLRWHGLGFRSCPIAQMNCRTVKISAEPCLPFAA